MVLDVVAENPEEQHVSKQVHQASVHEHGNQQRQGHGPGGGLQVDRGGLVADLDPHRRGHVLSGADFLRHRRKRICEAFVRPETLEKDEDQHIDQDERVGHDRRSDAACVVVADGKHDGDSGGAATSPARELSHERGTPASRQSSAADYDDPDAEELLHAKPAFLLTFQKVIGYSYVMAKGSPPAKTDVLQGTLDLMVLSTLEGRGPLHGYGIARRIEQISDAALRLNEGTVYTSLMRLQHRGWISATWGTSENNRKARYYAITPSGRRQLTAETKNWERIAGVIARLLRTVQQP